MDEVVEFPVYRKYQHNKTYFKITDHSSFDQLEILGKKYAVYTFKAKVHPDRIYIQDLLYNYKEYWISIEEIEYEEKLKYCRNNLTEFH